MDCADFAILVQRELFGRHVTLPAARPRIHTGGQRHVESISREYAAPTQHPKNGDLILMRQCGKSRATHVGVYFFRDYEAWVLHCSEDNGFSVAQRVRELPDSSVEVAGYYTWA